MFTANDLKELITTMAAEGKNKSEIIWEAALMCVGWPYVFGARGDYCEPVNRRARYTTEHPTIKTACRNFYGTVGCDGCKWYPDGQKVRCFGCRGFTYYLCKQVGVVIEGAGATSQWKKRSNWKAQGEIDTMPANTLCCLFVNKGNKMEHTGFGFNQETIECSAGVQYSTKRDKKWTHWAVPNGLDGEVVLPRPILRKGSKGESVELAQTMLMKQGYDVGNCGADGVFGKKTYSAVMQFQMDRGLAADGIVGAETWAALMDGNVVPMFTVQIPNLVERKAEELVKQYAGAVMIAESEG